MCGCFIQGLYFFHQLKNMRIFSRRQISPIGGSGCYQARSLVEQGSPLR
jgi:hypothetical protein